MRTPGDLPPRQRRPRPRRSLGRRGRVAIIVGVAVLLVALIFSRALASFYIDYLWHENLDRTDVFWGVLRTRALLFVSFATGFILLAILNLLIADRLSPRTLGNDVHPIVARFHELFGRRTRLLRIAIAVLFGLVVAIPASGRWKDWMLFRHGVEFNVDDPQFGEDVGFYVFKLPFLTFLLNWVFVALLLVTVLTAITHVLNGGIVLQPPIPKVRKGTRAHLAVLLAALALLRAGGYWLQRYDLTNDRRGFVQGATYAVVNAQLPAVTLLVMVAVLVAGLFIASVRTGSWRLPLIGSALWVVVSLVGAAIFPAAVQALVVNPNQKDREAPYIARNIDATRQAFDLARVETVPIGFNALSASDIESDVEPLRDVRLLNPEIMVKRFTTDEGQAAGLTVNDVEVDRYTIDGRAQQVLIAARELELSKIPNKSWQGRHLISTHGCGLVMAPASSVESDNGRPLYREVELDRPELYFSDKIDGFAVVRTDSAELGCPDEDGTTYEGTGGVQLNSGIRRLAFAWAFFDYNLFGSQSIKSDSRVIWIRNVRDRVEKLAPFLHFDGDPYPVALDGRTVWVIDAYTTTNRYPYAQNADRDQLTAASGLDHPFNYARNSVKAVVDAYDGSVDFYIVDPSDPIVLTWQKAFPDLFRSRDEMPADLLDHLRYPEDLFRVQTALYSKYFLDPAQFFDRNGAWSVAQAPSPEPRAERSDNTPPTTTPDSSGNNAANFFAAESRTDRFVPYYTMFHPPGADGAPPQFALLRPFVPFSPDDQRRELQAFMVASSDPATYGELTVYTVQDPLPDGPLTVANAIESDSEISARIALLNTQTSNVLLGDMQVVPIADGLLYVRPFYVATDERAELRFVIVSYNSRSALATTIGGALQQLFPSLEGLDVGDRQGVEPTTPPDGTDEPPPTEEATPEELLQQADVLFREADEALAQQDLGLYQQKVNEASELVRRALQLLTATPS